MTRVVMEHVEYELNVPETGVQPDSLTFVEIDQEKCIGCDTCQQYCPTGAIYGETFEPHTIKYRELCINCGQCLTHCPSMAIYEVRSWVPKLEEKLKDSHVKCVAMPAPSVRYALGEAFGLPVGTVTTGKMLSALKALGFSHCWNSRQTSPYGKRRLSLWNAWAAKKIFPSSHLAAPAGRNTPKRSTRNCCRIFRPASLPSA